MASQDSTSALWLQCAARIPVLIYSPRLCFVPANHDHDHADTDSVLRRNLDPSHVGRAGPFKCKDCVKEFPKLGKLNVHWNRNHKPIDEPCPLDCGKKWRVKANADSHARHECPLRFKRGQATKDDMSDEGDDDADEGSDDADDEDG